MRAGTYFQIPEGPADLAQLWRRARALDRATLPCWLTPESAATYRHLGAGPSATEAGGDDGTYRAELEQLEAAGLVIDRARGGDLAPLVYIAEPPAWDAWSIGLYGGDSPLHLGPLDAVANPVLTAADVSDVPAVLVADPFMLRAGTTWYMFFEVFNWRSNKGEIGLAVSDDGTRWSYRQIVLVEPFHLSYPYVFAWRDDYYMIPESFQAGGVRLYKAVTFPTRWSLVQVLLHGPYFVDASVLRSHGKWWLFTETNPEVNHDTLRLYYADHFLGPWHEHPQSPVVRADARLARPAGRLLVWNGRVIRFAQDCFPAYGTRVRAFEITELTSSTYREREVPLPALLAAGGTAWNACGMHHVDAHPLPDGRWVACVDGWNRPG
jgi:hypothetical protein